jgi:pimeloyl-ACP methyl ester carboxylesterase
MLRRVRRLLRYVRTWSGGSADLEETPVTVDRGDRRVPGTLVAPRDASGPGPGWVVFHGITRPGREHAELRRFVRSLAASGARVLVPEVPEWRELELAPGVTAPTLRGSVERLRSGAPGVSGVGVVGFSFGSPQAIRAAGELPAPWAPDVVVGFGGYWDLERTVHFLLTGEHEWEGRIHRLDPDPYGRWIVFANFLPELPGRPHAVEVARALRRLAAEAGDRQVDAAHPDIQAFRTELRGSLPRNALPLFDRLAPGDGEMAEPDEDLVAEVVEAVHRTRPRVDPSRGEPEGSVPVRLLHGRQDRLIPWSETLRMARALPGDQVVDCTVTGLFAHSRGHAGLSAVRRVGEGLRFARALSGVLDAV